MKKKLIILVLMLFSLCGCTKRFTVESTVDGKTTSKTYVSNILCKPESKKDIEIYKSNSDKLLVEYDKLPSCEKLKINSGGYEGIWTSFFVKPLAWLIVKLGLIVKNYGLSIMIIGLALRACMFPLSKKSMNMSENMKKAQKDLDAIERKYRGKEDKESMMAKSQDTMIVYKKYDINPVSGCLVSFLQLPIFFAFLEAVYRVPAFFEQKFLVFHLGQTPVEGFAQGNYWYIAIIIIIIATTYFSFKNMNTSGNDAQAKQMKMMSMFMIIFISIISFSLPTAIALYWIVSSGFTIVQNYLSKKGSKHNGKI